MRVYISSHSLDKANELATALEAAGHTVTSVWHRDGGPKLPLTEVAEWRDRADRNFLNICPSDVLALIGHTERVPGGKFVEAGYAMGKDIRVYVVGEVENGMMTCATPVTDTADLLRHLA